MFLQNDDVVLGLEAAAAAGWMLLKGKKETTARTSMNQVHTGVERQRHHQAQFTRKERRWCVAPGPALRCYTAKLLHF